jgi:hypothetical protein
MLVRHMTLAVTCSANLSHRLEFIKRIIFIISMPFEHAHARILGRCRKDGGLGWRHVDALIPAKTSLQKK